MSDSPVEPTAEPGRGAQLLKSTLKGVGLLALVAAISAGSAYEVFRWQIKGQQQATADQVATVRQELQTRQDRLEEQIAKVEKAAADARLLVTQNGDTTTLDAKLKEIDTLKLDLKKTQDDMDSRVKALQQSVVDEVAKQGKETAQALSLEMKWKTMLVKAQGEVLLSQVHWAEGNRGLAKDELANAGRTLQQAMEAAPDAVKPSIKETVDLCEQAKGALILEQSSARDTLNLLWHKVSDLMGPGK